MPGACLCKMSAYLLVLLVISAGLAPARMATKRREGQSAWDLLQCADPDPNRPNNRICDRCGSSVSKTIFYKNGHSDFTCPPRTLTTTGSGAQGGAEHHDGASGSAPQASLQVPPIGVLDVDVDVLLQPGHHDRPPQQLQREMQAGDAATATTRNAPTATTPVALAANRGCDGGRIGLAARVCAHGRSWHYLIRERGGGKGRTFWFFAEAGLQSGMGAK